MGERSVPEPWVVEPWWKRFDSTVLALLGHVARQPLDPLPRLVLADAREEHDETARAQFIRLQVHQGRISQIFREDSSLSPQERRLLSRHRNTWLEGLPRLKWIVWGGLIEGVMVEEAGDLQQARKHLDVCHVIWKPQHRENLLTHISLLSGVVALKLAGRPVGAAGVALVVHSSHVQDLVVLNLWANALGPTGAATLANSPHLHNLRNLNVSNNEIGDRGGEAAVIHAPLGLLFPLRASVKLPQKWNSLRQK
jgi:uncharacterized protein (TIGR02996 family)